MEAPMEWLARRIARPRRTGAAVPCATLLCAALLGTTLPLAGTARATVSDWPRQFDSASGTFIIYQPQPETLNGDVLSGRLAFSLQRSSDTQPTFGVMWFTERAFIDRDSSTVAARDFDVTKVRLPGITAADAARYERLVEAEAAGWDLSGSLEELQAGLASAEKVRASVADLDTVPPRIVFSETRAILVVYDGAPVTAPIEGSRLERVANTPYAVVHDPKAQAYYLNGANLWYEADDPRGPWTVIPNPPDAVRAVVPPDTSAADQVQGLAPLVLTATRPTEMIATDGPPRYAPLVEGELLYVTNTESDVVREIDSQQIYVLLAGRWYRAASEAGPWTFVRGDRLPSSFSRIPPASPKAHLLASVAGTPQAEDAIADAEIPQTSPIRRDASGFQVTYDGRPQFEPIPGSRLEYAVNTAAEVILADGRYYACDQGVWYVADDPEGPWKVSTERPTGVDDIPPSCPVYDVRYVYVYDVTPDFVYFGYLPGYIGCYPYYGTVVFGTGYYYRPWYGHRYFYPRPWTWGLYPRYNPWLSRWSFGFSYGRGFMRVGFNWYSGAPRAIHDPPRWLGPGGYRRPLLASDGTMIRTRRAMPLPAAPVERAPMNLYRRTPNLPRVDRMASPVPARRLGLPATPRERIPNNVFAGRDGQVYRRDPGGWKVNRGPSWVPAPVEMNPRPAPGWGAGDPARDERLPNWPPRPADPPIQRPPATPRAEPQRPAPPAASPAPGNLEREFQGRARAGGAARVPRTEPEKKKEEHPR
jgi:hypothetical protein